MNIGLKEIDQWHKERGWKGCGYHDIIRRNGTLEFGRKVNEIGAHVAGYNDKSVGICMVGPGDSKDNFTAAQFETLKRVLRFYKALFPEAVILGHRDFPDVHKACPGFDVREWLSKNPLEEK